MQAFAKMDKYKRGERDFYDIRGVYNGNPDVWKKERRRNPIIISVKSNKSFSNFDVV